MTKAREIAELGQKLTVDASGNLDIAGDITSDGLTVDGNPILNNASPQLMFQTGASHYNWQIAAQESTNAAFEIAVGGQDADASNDTYSPKVTVVQSGKVGINTTAPAAFLEVKSGDNEQFKITGTDTNPTTMMMDYNNGGSSKRIRIKNDDGDLKFATNNGNDRLTITEEGQFGLGITSPSLNTAYDRVLHIHSGLGSLIKLTDDSSGSAVNDGFDILQYAAGSYLINRDTNGFMVFTTQNQEAMRIDGQGRLLLGQTTNGSGFALQLQGSGGSAGDVSLTSDASKAELQSFNSKPLYINRQGNNVILNDGGGYTGIGTDAPSTQLEVKGTTFSIIRVNAANTHEAGIDFGDPDDNDIGRIRYDNPSNTMMFTVNAAERARIDSSGNLLVGTTAQIAPTNSGSTGHRIYPTGDILSNVDGSTVAYFNRLTSDGSITEFRKDGSTVGSIASRSGLVSTFILDPRTSGNGGAGITATGNTSHPSLLPTDETGTVTDGTIDFGTSGARWDSIYLSGGVYLGGTGSASKLDDYEEGSWTPVFQGSTTSGTYTYSAQTGYYTKVGNMVTASFRIVAITTSTTGSGYIQIAGLPFAKASNNLLHQGAVRLQSFNWNGTAHTYAVVEFISGSSVDEIYVRMNGDNDAGQDLQISHLVSGSSSMYGQLTYFV